MAKMTSTDIVYAERALDKLSRESVRRIVDAGAECAAERMRNNILKARHVRTGSMMRSTRPGNYIESLDGGLKYVYPYDYDENGTRNADKAYIINFGRGRRGGDRFITGDSGAAEAVHDAMDAERRRLLAEIT